MNSPARRARTPALLLLAAAAACVPLPARSSPSVRIDAPPPPSALPTRAVWDRDALTAAGVRRPERLLYGLDGTLYVLDGESRRIVALDPAGRAIRSVGGYGSDEASLQVPVDLVQDRRGSLLVLDRARGAVVAFDRAGRFLTARTLAAEALEEGRTPGARLLKDSFGSLWLLAPSARDVIPLDEGLGPARVSRFLEPRDSLSVPALAAFAPSGGGWVYDSGTRALRRFGSDGRLSLRASPGDSISAPFEPADLAADSSGALLIADPAGQRIVVVSPSGARAVTRYLGGGASPWRPTTLAAGPGGLLAVADVEQDEIQILSIARESTP